MRGGEWRWSTRVDENERGEGFKAKYGVEVTRGVVWGRGGGGARDRVDRSQRGLAASAGASCFSDQLEVATS